MAQEEGFTGYARTGLLVFMVFLVICGLGCMGVGIWMLADRYVQAYFTVLVRGVTDDAMIAMPPIMLVSGMFIIVSVILACLGLNKHNKTFLGIFLFLLVIVMIFELVIGFVVFRFRHEIHRTVKGGMKKQISEEYMFANTPGKAWNFVQVRKKCCGVDGPWDYERSEWWFSENKGFEDGLADAGIWVPKTCCVLDFNQDRDPSKVDPQDPRPRDEKRCQEDAEGRIQGSVNIHARGCFATLMDITPIHINLLIGMGLAIGFFQILGLISGIILMRTEIERY